MHIIFCLFWSQNIPYQGNEETVSEINVDYDEMVLFVGKMADWKRVDALVRAASVYEKKIEKKILTLIVGAGPAEDLKRLQLLAKEKNAKNVIFCGPKMHSKLVRLYNVATVGVFPSKDEPFGQVFVECLACGTPVIGADSGGPRTFISKECGFLVPESDDKNEFSKRIANTVIEAVQKDWKNTKMEAALQTAEQFTIFSKTKKMMDETWRLLDRGLETE